MSGRKFLFGCPIILSEEVGSWMFARVVRDDEFMDKVMRTMVEATDRLIMETVLKRNRCFMWRLADGRMVESRLREPGLYQEDHDG